MYFCFEKKNTFFLSKKFCTLRNIIKQYNKTIMHNNTTLCLGETKYTGAIHVQNFKIFSIIKYTRK